MASDKTLFVFVAGDRVLGRRRADYCSFSANETLVVGSQIAEVIEVVRVILAETGKSLLETAASYKPLYFEDREDRWPVTSENIDVSDGDIEWADPESVVIVFLTQVRGKGARRTTT